MGQRQSTNNVAIEEQINNDTWQSFNHHSKVVVDLMKTDVVNPYKHKYIIKLDSSIPPVAAETTLLLFPNHPEEKKRLLYLHGYSITKFARELNARIQKSSREGITFAVAYNDTYFLFKNVVGNVYLVWPERVNVQTINISENIVHEDPYPILIEKNTANGYLSVYNFKFREFMSLSDTTIHDNIHLNIFCLETDRRDEEKNRRAVIISNSTSDAITKDRLVRQLVSMDDEEPPFSYRDVKILPTTDRVTNYIVRDPEKPDEE